MNEPSQLVEHFFRHQYGRLVAMLTRSFGVRNLEIIEDSAQTAMSKALIHWSKSGIPKEPNAWLFRTASNVLVDRLRRQKWETPVDVERTDSIDLASNHHSEYGCSDEVGDEPLRLLFLCCHSTIPVESRIAFALKTIGGFGTSEIASALLISNANAEKRITRAKEKLRELGEEIALLDSRIMEDRIDAVRSTIYLLFNEGFAASSGRENLRRDVCDEAIRLTRMLIRFCKFEHATTSALLALMLLHSSRFDSRVDTQGAIVLLEDQDRSKWNWHAIREAMDCMMIATQGTVLSRYHVESAIAWEHCRVQSFEETNWEKIVEYYHVLNREFPGPMVSLNAAISLGYRDGPEVGLSALTAIDPSARSKLRPWWDCAMADAFRRMGKTAEAIAHWHDARTLASNSQQQELIDRRMDASKGSGLFDDGI